jgi:hypothetical protein
LTLSGAVCIIYMQFRDSRDGELYQGFKEGAMISFSKVYGTDHSTANAIKQSVDAKPNALTKAQEDAGISQKAMINMKEMGKGNKIDTTA